MSAIDLHRTTVSEQEDLRRPQKNLGSLGPISHFAGNLLHGVALAAFFIMPFLFEAQFVQLGSVTGYRIAESFRSLSEVFAAPRAFDPHHVTAIALDWPSLGWPHFCMALLGLAAILIRYFYQKRDGQLVAPVATTISAGASIAFLIILIQPFTGFIWELIPGADFLQFLWRLLSPATLLLAWLGATGVSMLSTRLQRIVGLFAIAAFFLFTLTWTYHNPFTLLPESSSPTDLIQTEIEYPHFFGTTTTQEFLPRWVEELPESDSLLHRYGEDTLPARLDAIPEGVTKIAETTTPTGVSFDYKADRNFTALFRLFYFPTWVAHIDGEPTVIGIEETRGLIRLDLPAGRHKAELSLRPTTPYVVGIAISVFSGLLLFVRFRFRKSGARNQEVHGIPNRQIGESEQSTAIVFTILFVGLLGLRIFVLDPRDTLFRFSEIDDPPNPVTVNFDDQLILIGSQFPQSKPISANRPFDVNLYWRAARLLDTDYQTTVQLVDEFGNRFGQSDNSPPSTSPTSLWFPEQYARDAHQILPLTGTPPGEYRIVVGAYSFSLSNYSTLSLGVRDESGNLAGIEYELGKVRVERGRPQPPGSLRLVEGTLGASAAGLGEPIPINLLWNSGDSLIGGLRAKISFISVDGDGHYEIEVSPVRDVYPSELWTANELIRGFHTITLPPELSAGRTTVSIQLVTSDGVEATKPYTLGDIEITEPVRMYDLPVMEAITMYDFNDAIRLLGYDRTSADITLYWQALHPVAESLTVFVHRLDESGALVDGHDSPPARSTLGWLPGEIITDVHPISVGERFGIGLYEPLSAERFGKALLVGP